MDIFPYDLATAAATHVAGPFVARFDLKADRKRCALHILSCRLEGTASSRPAASRNGEAARSALSRYADALELKPTGWRLP